MSKNINIIPVKYIVSEDIYLEDRDPLKPSETKKSWAITRNGSCFDKTLNEFVYEPFPSSRTAEFFDACRFTFAEALEILEKLREQDRV